MAAFFKCIISTLSALIHINYLLVICRWTSMAVFTTFRTLASFCNSTMIKVLQSDILNSFLNTILYTLSIKSKMYSRFEIKTAPILTLLSIRCTKFFLFIHLYSFYPFSTNIQPWQKGYITLLNKHYINRLILSKDYTP